MLSKPCSQCGADKLLDQFAFRSVSSGKIRSECKACQLVKRSARKVETTLYNKAYHAANREAMSARNKANHWANRASILPKMRARANARYWGDDQHMANVAHQSVVARAGTEKVIPQWADMDATSSMYKYARALRAIGLDVEVDHIVPIRSKRVCGLHVHDNLRVISALANRQKKNMRWPEDMPGTATPYKLPL